MESGVFLACLDQFMLSPLVTWVSNAEVSFPACNCDINLFLTNRPVSSVPQVKTFAPHDGGTHLDFSELLDGVFLNDIMSQM